MAYLRPYVVYVDEKRPAPHPSEVLGLIAYNPVVALHCASNLMTAPVLCTLGKTSTQKVWLARGMLYYAQKFGDPHGRHCGRRLVSESRMIFEGTGETPPPLTFGHIRGRHDENTRNIASNLVTGRDTVVMSRQGFGKTYLLESVAALLHENSFRTLRIQATALLNPVPFGSLTNGSNLSLASALGDETAITAARFVEVIVQLAGRTPIVLVDDAHLLDPSTMNLLYQLSSGKAITLLLTSDLAPLDTEVNAAADTTRLIGDLWARGTAIRVDLNPITKTEACDLVRELAPQAQFDRVTMALLHARSGGSRVILRELTADAVAQQHAPNAVRSVLAHRPSRRLLDLLAHQLRTLAPQQCSSLALIGRLDGLCESHALLVCPPGAVRDLLHRGFVYYDAARPGILLPHVLLADAAADLCDSAALEGQTGLIVELLLVDHAHHRSLTRAASVVVADTWISRSLTAAALVERWGLTMVTEVLLTAARWSRSVGASQKSLVYARLLVQVEADLKATIELSRSLAATGQLALAIEAMDFSSKLVREPSDVVKLSRWTQSLSKFNAAAATHFSDSTVHLANLFSANPLLTGEISLTQLIHQARELAEENTATLGEALARNDSYNVVTRIRAACFSAIAYGQAGQSALALDLIRFAITLNEADKLNRDADIYASQGLSLEIFYSCAAVHSLTGLDLTAISLELDRWITTSIANRDYGNLMLLSLVSAQIPDIGELCPSPRSRGESQNSGQNDWKVWLLCFEASSLGRLGLLEAARVSRAEAHSVPSRQSSSGPTPALLDANTEGPSPHVRAELTPREREVSALAETGLSNRQIATTLFLSVRTVESHRYQARLKIEERQPDTAPESNISKPAPDAHTLDDYADTIVNRITEN